MQKRGMFLLEILVKLVPVILILLLFLGFVFVFLPSLIGTKNVQTKNSFQTTWKTVDQMLSNKDSFEASDITVTMPASTLLKGYSSNALSEPVNCNGQACLCYFDDYRNIAENKPVDCYVFENTPFYDEIHLITTPDPLKKYNTEQTKLMYGLGWDPQPNIKYPAPLDTWSYGNLFVQTANEEINNIHSAQFYIEKYAVGRKAYVLIARIVEAEEITVPFKDGIRVIDSSIGITEKQKLQRKEVLRLCPEGSASECVSSPINSKVGEQTCIMTIQGTCTLTEIEQCAPEQKATKMCLCVFMPIDAGNFCTQDNTGTYISLPYSCSQVKSCSDYCKFGDSTLCDSQNENLICGQDSCKVGGCLVDAATQCSPRDTSAPQ